MTQTVDLEKIKEKLIENLRSSGWSTKLKSFIQSSEFDKILQTLYQEMVEGKRFTPPVKEMFRAFEQCPLDKLKVVVIGQDAYPHLGVADGIAFSCSKTKKPQPSLQKIFEAINATVYPDAPFELVHDPDLTRWANQGVLLLNRALTCQVDKAGSHFHIWNDFIMYVIDMLSLTNSGLIFILLGAKAQELESVISPAHYVLKASHPASASYSKTDWDCQDVFNKANQIIEKNNGKAFRIDW